LAPEELGRRSQQLRTTIPPLRTVSIPGGRQALARTDLALLLSLIDEPDEMKGLLSITERRWLRRRSEMDDLDAECWRSLPADEA
jgi:hypothetical protein